MDERELAKARQRQEEFTRRAARAARRSGHSEPTEDEIVEAVKATRETIYGERYGAVSSPECPDVSAVVPAEGQGEGSDG